MSNSVSGFAPPENVSIPDFAAVLRTRTVMLLKAMNTLAGNYVDSTRVLPVGIADAPRILVFMNARSYVWKGDNAPQYDTTGRLTVMGYVTGADHITVENNTETLGSSIISLMDQPGFLAPPVERVTGIEVTFDMTGEGDRYEGTFIAEFAVKWTEIFEPVLAPLPNGYGAVGSEVVLMEETMAGEILTVATISLASS